MGTDMGAGDAAGGASAGSSGASHAVGPDLALDAGDRGGEGVSGDLLVDVHGLGVLAEVVEAGEAAGAVALKGPFAGVFSDMASQVLAPGEAQIARGEVCAEEALALFLLGRGAGAGVAPVVGAVVFAL